MKVRKNTLWRVPVYCAVAGIVSFHAEVYLLSKFAIEKLSDGTVVSNDAKANIVYILVFAAVVLLGGLAFFRKMTRKELFWSTTIYAALNLVVYLAQVISGIATGPGAVAFLYISLLFEWKNIVSLLLYRAFGDVWIIGVISILVPYLFILFGRNSEETAQEEPS